MEYWAELLHKSFGRADELLSVRQFFDVVLRAAARGPRDGRVVGGGRGLLHAASLQQLLQRRQQCRRGHAARVARLLGLPAAERRPPPRLVTPPLPRQLLLAGLAAAQSPCLQHRAVANADLAVEL